MEADSSTINLFHGLNQDITVELRILTVLSHSVVIVRVRTRTQTVTVERH